MTGREKVSDAIRSRTPHPKGFLSSLPADLGCLNCVRPAGDALAIFNDLAIPVPALWALERPFVLTYINCLDLR